MYANSRKAFHRFTRDTRKPEKRGFNVVEDGGINEGDDKEEAEEEVDDYNPNGCKNS